jgi:hypothetical protein
MGATLGEIIVFRQWLGVTLIYHARIVEPFAPTPRLVGLGLLPFTTSQNTTNRSSAIDARTTRHPGYAISQQKRKRTEEPFGWAKMIGGLARPMLRGVARLGFKFIFTMAAYDLIRLPKLLGLSA